MENIIDSDFEDNEVEIIEGQCNKTNEQLEELGI